MDFDKSFNEWYDKQGFGESSDIKEMMYKAYYKGARDMLDDIVSLLGDFATACAGLDDKVYTYTEAFDASAEHIRDYYAEH